MTGVPLSFSQVAPGYNPPLYSMARDDADPDDMSQIPFNTVQNPHDRRSYHGLIAFDQATGHPLNPCGRTGTAGRGSFPLWGPNHYLFLIMIRWAINIATGERLIDPTTNLPILELFIVERHNNGNSIWTLPNDDFYTDRSIFSSFVQLFLDDAVAVPGDDTPQQERRRYIDASNFCAQMDIVYKGHKDDSGNTDNAWSEGTVGSVRVRDDGPPGLTLISDSTTPNQGQWVIIDNTLQLPFGLTPIVRAIAQHYNGNL